MKKWIKQKKTEILCFLFAFIAIFIAKTIYSFKIYDFGQDLARDLFLMEKAIQNKDLFFVYGPKASVGNFYLLPAYYQINLFLAYLTNNHYATMQMFVIFFESFTPILLFLILRKIPLSRKISFFLSIIYLISPLVMIFSSFAWNPNTIPFLSVLMLYLTIIYYEKKKTFPLILIPILLFLAISFHLQAVVLILPFFILSIYVFLYRKNDLKYLMYGILLMFIMFTPYLFGEIKNNFLNTRAIINYFQSEHSQYYERVSKINYIFNFFPAFFERILIHKEVKILLIGRLIYFFGFFYFIYKAVKEKKIHLLLLIYFFSIFLMLRIYKGDKIDYYMSTLFILPIILLGYLWRKSRYLAVVLLIAITFFSGKYYLNLKPNNELSNKMRVVSEIKNNAPSSSVRLLVHDKNEINTFLYLIDKKTNLTIDQNSLYLLEIFPKNYVLNNQDRSVIYRSLLLEKSGGKLLYSSSESGQQINYWLLETNEHNIGYSLYNYNLEYGTDSLNKDLYEK